ncbi:hypothetical protein AB4212_60080, partial [Streptomyces sp. 2MCAF27]
AEDIQVDGLGLLWFLGVYGLCGVWSGCRWLVIGFLGSVLFRAVGGRRGCSGARDHAQAGSLVMRGEQDFQDVSAGLWGKVEQLEVIELSVGRRLLCGGAVVGDVPACGAGQGAEGEDDEGPVGIAVG